jgi:hypothetical protein
MDLTDTFHQEDTITLTEEEKKEAGQLQMEERLRRKNPLAWDNLMAKQREEQSESIQRFLATRSVDDASQALMHFQSSRPSQHEGYDLPTALSDAFQMLTPPGFRPNPLYPTYEHFAKAFPLHGSSPYDPMRGLVPVPGSSTQVQTSATAFPANLHRSSPYDPMTSLPPTGRSFQVQADTAAGPTTEMSAPPHPRSGQYGDLLPSRGLSTLSRTTATNTHGTSTSPPHPFSSRPSQVLRRRSSGNLKLSALRLPAMQNSPESLSAHSPKKQQTLPPFAHASPEARIASPLDRSNPSHPPNGPVPIPGSNTQVQTSTATSPKVTVNAAREDARTQTVTASSADSTSPTFKANPRFVKILAREAEKMALEKKC